MLLLLSMILHIFLQEQSCVNGLLSFSQMISKNSSWPIHNIALDVVHFRVLLQHIFSFTLFTNMFSLGLDDGHRVILESISGSVDCEHDYINASYIDVRIKHCKHLLVKMIMMTLIG